MYCALNIDDYVLGKRSLSKKYSMSWSSPHVKAAANSMRHNAHCKEEVLSVV